MQLRNILTDLPTAQPGEVLETLVERGSVRIERIISNGQATPAGEWYDQDWDEWVVLLTGSAGLLLEGDSEPRVMKSGDHILIPAHCRHRVDWTDPMQTTLWLAVHLGLKSK
ncbi:MAG TPA: cupin [Desulfuromonadaceae bacterium]|jgi:cupin 2 domain-containing protein